MAFREVSVYEVREVLRLWLRGEGLRAIDRMAGTDRKTVRRYVQAAVELGLDRSGGDDQLSDDLIGAVVERVRPARPHGYGLARESLMAHGAQIRSWLDDDDLTLTKVADLLARRGVVVPYMTLHRFAVAECGFGQRRLSVRVADGEPGKECQVDFGRMGLVPDPDTAKQRVLWALIFTACYSRHLFCWLSFRQTTEAVIAGFEAAWGFFGGVFAVVIPDNLKAIVTKADATEPRFNSAFLDYASSRGFVIDAARVRKPRDKARCERVVPYVRGSFFSGEDFADRDDAQARAERWCAQVAGMRIHGTTCARPAEVFAAEEAPVLLPRPSAPYDLPIYSRPKVHPDRHVEVGRALYSVPGELVGAHLEARADSKLVRLSHRGQVIKVHPRQAPGGRITDPADLPSEKATYALRDLDSLRRQAARHGPAVAALAGAVLDHPLPWTKMRQVYRLLGLVRRYGDKRVEEACGRAMEAEAADVGLVARMLERAVEASPQPALPAMGKLIEGRFARDAREFGVEREEGR